MKLFSTQYNFILSALVIILSFSCAFGSNENNIYIPFPQKYNVIFISVDTLRADHLGCYGYFRNTSPNIDKLAKEGILFEQAITQATMTLPSHASIFTSQYVPTHGVYFLNRLPDINMTLAELLKSNGYKTAAFTGSGHVNSIFNLDQGFDIFDDRKPKDGSWGGSFNETVPLALNWLKRNKENNFFLFLHGYDVHEPYHCSRENIFDFNYKGPIDDIRLIDLWWQMYKEFFLNQKNQLVRFTSKDINHIIAHYDGGIRYADEKIGEFLEGIKKLGILDSTVIVLFGDHGEELNDHGHITKHGHNYYDEVLRVPLIIRHSKIKGPKRIKTQAQLIDVMPTILDFLGISIGNNREIQGKSLLPLIAGTASPDFNEYVYSEFNIVRSLKWKAISQNELYDLENDPKELNNLATLKPEVLLNLNRKFIEWRSRCGPMIERKLIQIHSEIGANIKNKEEIRDVGYW